MAHAPPLITTVMFFSILLLLVLSFFTVSNAHNITRILAKHPEFSTFNHYLTTTHLAAEINRRETITVLAVDNAGMSSLLSKNLPLYTLKNVLSLHVLVDYFGAKKLHQINDGTALTSTMFQATGAATGTSGFVNITDLKGGKVAFGTEDGNLNAAYVKSVVEIPYNISVLQISQALTSTEAEAPAGGPSDINVTEIMSKQGCKAFADLLKSSGADSTYQESIDGGLTVFCPTDTVINSFMPRYKNLSAPHKVSLLLYHGVPVYQSLQMLKTSNGVINTLATDGANKYDFTVQNDGEEVTLKTKVVTADITGTVKDEEPLVVYKIDKVLLPKELFKASDGDDDVAESPKPSKKKHSPKGKKQAAEAPDGGDDADSPGSDSDDQTADDSDDSSNGAVGLGGWRSVMAVLSVWVGVLVM